MAGNMTSAQLNYAATTAGFEEFMTQLLKVLHKREQMDTVYEQE